MGNFVLRKLLAEVNTAEWFAVIADEATDINHYELMCIAVQWVGEAYKVHEAALGLVELPDTKASTLFSILKDTLTRCSLQIPNCVGQALMVHQT